MSLDFSTAQAAELTGTTARMLDSWSRTALLRASGREAAGKGSRRRYTFRDLIVLRAIKDLRDKGCPLQQVRQAVHELREQQDRESTSDMLARVTLVADGRKVLLLKDEHEIVEAVTRQTVLCLPMAPLVHETNRRVQATPLEWAEQVRVRGKTFKLTVTRARGQQDFIVRCRSLPGLLHSGNSPTAALEKARSAIASILQLQTRSREGRSVVRQKKTG